MPKPTVFQEAWLRVEADLVEMTNKLKDIGNNVASLNAEVILIDQPTINQQLVLPELRECIENLFDQLHNIRYNAENDPETEQLKSPVFREDLVRRAVSGLEAMIELSHNMSSSSGWWKGENGEDLKEAPFMFPTKIALCHSELSEALEADRKDKMDDHLPHLSGVSVEFADLLHRVFDLCGAFGIELSRAYIEKGIYNLERADHKRAHRTAPGGKKY